MRVKNPYDTPTDEFQMVKPSKPENLKPNFDLKRLSKFLDEFEENISNEKLLPVKGLINNIREKIRIVENGGGKKGRTFVTGQIIMQTRALVKSIGISNDFVSSLTMEAERLAKSIDFKTPTY